jgi:predicted phosphodiesterase
MKRKRFAIAAAIIAVLVLAYFLYAKATYVHMDLSTLREFAKTQSYDVIIRSIQAKPVSAEGFSFVALGDTRSNIDVARNVLSQAAKEKPLFILCNGDIVRRGRVEEYTAHHMQLIDMIAPVPMLVAPGNHERGPNGDFEPFRALTGGERFSFDYGGCRFVGLNNADWNGMSNDDIEYLETELSKPGVEHKFVVFHVPPRFLEDAIETEEGRGFSWNARRMRALFTKEKVDQVFVGHVHGFATQVVDGVRYTITGGAGANLAESLKKEGQVHNFVVVHVTPQGVRDEVVKEINGEWVRSDIQ